MNQIAIIFVGSCLFKGSTKSKKEACQHQYNIDYQNNCISHIIIHLRKYKIEYTEKHCGYNVPYHPINFIMTKKEVKQQRYKIPSYYDLRQIILPFQRVHEYYTYINRHQHNGYDPNHCVFYSYIHFQ